jgi:hypothetical protein
MTTMNSKPATDKLTVNKLRAWARENRSLAETVLTAQAFAEIERERVDTYVAPIFARYGFKDDEGNAIASPRKLYLCEDDAACAAFYAECDTAHRAHGFTGGAGECPALVAEDLLTKAQNLLLDSLARFVGVDGFAGSLELREKALKLAIGSCFADGK